MKNEINRYGRLPASAGLFAAGLVVVALVMAGCCSRLGAVKYGQVEGSIVNSIGMSLIEVKPGSFLMFGQELQSKSLLPRPNGFNVTIKTEYYLGQYEVTQSEYEKVMGENPSAFKGKKRPVEQVSWEKALEFCRRLSECEKEKRAGRVYSLPSEREWQYAARAGSDRLFSYGSDDESKIAGAAVCRDSYTEVMPKQTAEAGSKKPNAWGFYDMEGNVWEWVLDSHDENSHYLANASGDQIVWTNGAQRVMAGGGWDNDFRMCNCSARYRGYPGKRSNNLGFRVKCAVEKAAKRTATP